MATYYDELKEVEDKLYKQEFLTPFLDKYPVSELLSSLVQSKDNNKTERLQTLLSQILRTERAKDLVRLYRAPKQKQTILHKYIASERSEQFFRYLEEKTSLVSQLIQEDSTVVQLLFKLIGLEHGVKAMRMWIKLYKDPSELLFTKEIEKHLEAGLKNEDTVVQMRYMELIVTAATKNEQAFKFFRDNGLLHKAVQLYNTKDILLKLNVAEVIEILSNSPATIEFLKSDEQIWKMILNEAFDEETEFYVKKYLIQLISKMHASGCLKLSPEIQKNITVFVRQTIKSKDYEQQNAALTVVGHLLSTHEGTKIVVGDATILNHYLAFSKTNKDELKGKFITSLANLAISGSKPQSLVINLLSCVGNNELALSANLKENTKNTSGLEDFSKWLYSWLMVPFHELQMEGVFLFRELLDYKEICQALFRNKNTIQFFRLTGKDDFIIAKNTLIKEIMRRGREDWKDHELSEFTKVLEVELQKKDTQEMMYEVVSK